MEALDLEIVIVIRLEIVRIASTKLSIRTCGAMTAYAYNNPQIKSDLMTDVTITRNTKKNDSVYMDWHIVTIVHSINMHI